MAPRQPRKPVTMTMAPMPMTMLAADSAGKEGEKVAKLPWETESQMPTPSSPQPHNCKTKGKRVERWANRRARLKTGLSPISITKGLPCCTLSAVDRFHCNYKHNKSISCGKDYNKNGTWAMLVCTFELLMRNREQQKMQLLTCFGKIDAFELSQHCSMNRKSVCSM